MIAFIVISSALILLLMASCTFLAWRLIVINDRMENILEATEDALDEIDRVGERLTALSKVPLLSDEPEVRRMVSDVRSVRTSVFRIGAALDGAVYDDDEEEKED